MRLEDWQKWLDTQFIDPAEVEKDKAADSEWPAVIESQPLQESVSEPESTPEQLEVFASDPEPAAESHVESRVEAPAEFKAGPSGFVEDVSVPSIEQYLPFLRGTSVPDEPKVEASAPPAKEDTGEAEVQAGATEADIESAAISAEDETEEVFAAEAAETEAIVAAPDGPVTAPAAVEVIPVAIAAAAVVEEDIPAHIRAVQPGRRIVDSRKRTRNTKRVDANQVSAKLADGELWSLAPRHIQALMAANPADSALSDDEMASRESRVDLISKLLDPDIALEDTARQLDVHPLTVKKYAAAGSLTRQRASGDQRRFKLSDVLGFLESQSRINSGS